MRKLAKFLRDLPNLAKALIITCVALAASHFIVYDLTSISYFAPMEKASDFKFSDFYTLVANSDTTQAIYDRDIVIVPVDSCTRLEMACVINDIDKCCPAVVGFDIAFDAPKNPDSVALPEALESCDNLVLPIKIVYKNGRQETEHKSYYDQFFEPSGGYAPTNIEGIEGTLSCTRMFSPCFDTDEGMLKSFALRLVEFKDPEIAERMSEKGTESQYISFFRREYDTVYPNEIVKKRDLIQDRIVLVGKLKDKADCHITPMGNDTPGLIIHAYIASTILSGKQIRKLTDAESYAITFALTLFFVWISVWLSDTPIGDLVVRCLQFLLLIAMIVGGCYVYIRHLIDLDFAFPIVGIGLGVAACDVYSGLFAKDGLIDIISGWNPKLLMSWKDKAEKKYNNISNTNTMKCKIQKKTLAFVLMVLSSMPGMKATYTIYMVKGNVKVTNNGKDRQAKEDGTIKLDDYLTITKDSKIKILDSSNDKVYTFSTPGTEMFRNLKEQKEKSSQELIDKINKELRTTIENNKKKGPSVYGRVGMSVHNTDAIIRSNLNVPKGMSYLGYLMSIKPKEGYDSTADALLLDRYVNEEEKTFNFGVFNTTENPLYYNVIHADAQSRPRLLFEKNPTARPYDMTMETENEFAVSDEKSVFILVASTEDFTQADVERLLDPTYEPESDYYFSVLIK